MRMAGTMSHSFAISVAVSTVDGRATKEMTCALAGDLQAIE
ncbi:hypothetical protein [Paraburkholderia sejongensis]|nr:hypothetical protein [Paraburkholderia sp. MMS20-SJTR3]